MGKATISWGNSSIHMWDQAFTLLNGKLWKSHKKRICGKESEDVLLRLLH
jgi:hypothetical protein